MPLRISRRPFTACPYTWSLTVAGIDTGVGSVSEAQCADLNGSYDLTYRPCLSTGAILVWETGCEASFVDNGCALYEATIAGITGFPCADTYNGTFLFRGFVEPWLGYIDCVYKSNPSLSDLVTDASTDCTCTAPGATAPAWIFPATFAQPHLFPNHSGLTVSSTLTIYDFAPAYYQRAGGDLGAPATVEFTLARVNCGSGWPETITAIRLDDTNIGPLPNDRTRGKFRLEYDIATEAFTLHSFERVQFPKWRLVDSDPCTGDTKELTLVDPPDGTHNGCYNAPSTVTLTRACSPARNARDHKRNKQTGQLKRPCGCACDDEVDDRRSGCPKCESTATEGCETYDEQDIACKYPKSADCCDYCPEDTAPCAYEALTTCDLSYNGIPIMAKTVTLRHKCYFEDTCDWVAVGPSPNPEDGGLGAQPVCATCSDTCLTGCSWSSWQTATCPDEPCGDACPTVAEFTVVVGEIRGVTGEVVLSSDSVTVTYDGSGEWTGRGANGVGVRLNTEATCEGIQLSIPYAGGTTLDAVYNLASPRPIDCSGANQFSFTSTENSGSSWPTPITVTRI